MGTLTSHLSSLMSVSGNLIFFSAFFSHFIPYFLYICPSSPLCHCLPSFQTLFYTSSLLRNSCCVHGWLAVGTSIWLAIYSSIYLQFREYYAYAPTSNKGISHFWLHCAHSLRAFSGLELSLLRASGGVPPPPKAWLELAELGMI